MQAGQIASIGPRDEVLAAINKANAQMMRGPGKLAPRQEARRAS
jgi:hypothetical protein